METREIRQHLLNINEQLRELNEAVNFIALIAQKEYGTPENETNQQQEKPRITPKDND